MRVLSARICLLVVIAMPSFISGRCYSQIITSLYPNGAPYDSSSWGSWMRASLRAEGEGSAASGPPSGASGDATQNPPPQSCNDQGLQPSALFGIGSMIQSPAVTDYTNNSNVLQTTHLGAATPQFLAGMGAQLPFIHETSSCTSIFRDPIQLFISAKFAPEASNTLNGFTFGLGHAIHKNASIMIGYSLNPISEPSPGFINAAAQLVQTAQADQKDYSSLYLNFDPKLMKTNAPDAFDGFPTQTINAQGTPGALLYPGTVLTTHYHSGIFLGFAIDINFKIPGQPAAQPASAPGEVTEH